METLVLLAAVLFLSGFGYWLMCRLDRYLQHSGSLLRWDEEEEQKHKPDRKKSA